MKAFLISCLLYLASVSIVAQDLTLDDVRKKYPLATKNDSVCKELYNALNGKADGTDVLSGYAGGVTMLMAKSTANPFSKMEYFQRRQEAPRRSHIT
jgi:hypothetical protein